MNQSRRIHPARGGLTDAPALPDGRLRVGIGLLASLLFVLTSACTPSDDSSCPEACPPGQVCEARTQTCQPARLPDWSEPPPGRDASITTADGRFWVASRAPDDGTVLVGQLDGTRPDLRVLTDTAARTPGGLGLAGGPGGPAVAWLTPQRRYRVAIRFDERWVLYNPIQVDERDYRGTADFELVIDANRDLHVVFRDGRDDRLYAFHRRGTDPWTVELVDDGTRDSINHGCRQSTPDMPTSGVGYTPDAARVDGDLFVAYYDADCGDLRLARRPEDPAERWVIDVVDTGDFAPSPDAPLEPGDVGRFPSLATTPEGRLAIAYQDVGRGRLMYASENNGRFNSELVDPGLELDDFSQNQKVLVGAFADMTVDADGRPRIVYYNGTRNRLQLARRGLDAQNNLRWIHQTLSPAPPAGFFAGLARNGAGREFIVAERFEPEASGSRSRMTVVEGNSP